jgi:hypothetical protein
VLPPPCHCLGYSHRQPISAAAISAPAAGAQLHIHIGPLRRSGGFVPTYLGNAGSCASTAQCPPTDATIPGNAWDPAAAPRWFKLSPAAPRFPRYVMKYLPSGQVPNVRALGLATSPAAYVLATPSAARADACLRLIAPRAGPGVPGVPQRLLQQEHPGRRCGLAGHRRAAGRPHLLHHHPAGQAQPLLVSSSHSPAVLVPPCSCMTLGCCLASKPIQSLPRPCRRCVPKGTPCSVASPPPSQCTGSVVFLLQSIGDPELLDYSRQV